jgi:hypothetical protein
MHKGGAGASAASAAKPVSCDKGQITVWLTEHETAAPVAGATVMLFAVPKHYGQTNAHACPASKRYGHVYGVWVYGVWVYGVWVYGCTVDGWMGVRWMGGWVYGCMGRTVRCMGVWVYGVRCMGMVYGVWWMGVGVQECTVFQNMSPLAYTRYHSHATISPLALPP